MKQLGLIHALQIDDIDSSISYNKSEVDSIYRHKVTLTELTEIFNNRNYNIFQIATDDCLLLITDDGSEIPMDKFKLKDVDKYMFIRLMDPCLHDNDVIIPIKAGDYIKENVKWSNNIKKNILPEKMQIHSRQFSESDVYGYRNTKLINESGSVVPAADYCYEQFVNAGNDVYQGYLPSLSQFIFMYNNIDLINYIIRYCKQPTLTFWQHYWTSSEHSQFNAWYFNNNFLGNVELKNSWGYALPFFKKIN